MKMLDLSAEFPGIHASVIQKLLDEGKSHAEICAILKEKKKEKDALYQEFTELFPQVIEEVYNTSTDFEQAQRRLKRRHIEQCRSQMIKEHPEVTEMVLEALFGPRVDNVDTPPPMIKKHSGPTGDQKQELLDMYSPYNRLFGFETLSSFPRMVGIGNKPLSRTLNQW
eukprot:TRINITY_DN998_c0_g1_i1.p1 TRINITY_DN998_c0_g1~~TRINITY_DN998_c0_g1_i1.p1  ORF type:complete len:168 (+),score=27.80 TRINITY_DN998_c0_g1_i1:230-733(+)